MFFVYSESFQNFVQDLENLKQPQKSIISSMTTFADVNVRFADDIVKVIENKIINAQPEEKITVLYLLDSIVKNVKSVYIEAFSKNLFVLFRSAYETSDIKSKVILRNLFATWMGVFPQHVITAIEDLIKKEIFDPNNVKVEDKAFIFTTNSFYSAITTGRLKKKVPDLHLARLPTVAKQTTLEERKNNDEGNNALVVNEGCVNNKVAEINELEEPNIQSVIGNLSQDDLLGLMNLLAGENQNQNSAFVENAPHVNDIKTVGKEKRKRDMESQVKKKKWY
jgi:hypothetical protein